MAVGRPKGPTAGRVLCPHLRFWRLLRQLSAEDMLQQMASNGLVVSRSTLYYWEAGQAGVPLLGVPVIAKILGVTEQDLQRVAKNAESYTANPQSSTRLRMARRGRGAVEPLRKDSTGPI